jgi:hypothetical protein
MRTVEIRTYDLKPATRDAFHQLMLERSVPMLRRWNVDVVAHGKSAHDDTTYFLIRSYASLVERDESQDRFYGSDEWRSGPREAILALIDHYTTLVLELPEAAVEALRASA